MPVGKRLGPWALQLGLAGPRVRRLARREGGGDGDRRATTGLRGHTYVHGGPDANDQLNMRPYRTWRVPWLDEAIDREA